MKPPPDLVRAIAANPDDDGPRLAYADWLDAGDGFVECGTCVKAAYSPRVWCPHCSGEGCTAQSIAAIGPCYAQEPCPECRGEGGTPNHYASRAGFIRIQCELQRIPDMPAICTSLVSRHDRRTCPRCAWERTHAEKVRQLSYRETMLHSRFAAGWLGRFPGEWAGGLFVRMVRGFAVVRGPLWLVQATLPRILEVDGFAWPVASDVVPTIQMIPHLSWQASGRFYPVTTKINFLLGRAEGDERGQFNLPDPLFSRLLDSGRGQRQPQNPNPLDRPRLDQAHLLADWQAQSRAAAARPCLIWSTEADAHHAVSYAILALALGWASP